MSTPQPQPNPYGGKPVVLPPPKENGLGIAGFIVSAIGIVTCGVPSIFGVILSAIGLGKEPKGMAIAGLILGLIGLVELVGVGFLMFVGFQSAQQFSQVIQQSVAEAQLESNANEIGEVWEESGSVPSQEEGDELVANSFDAWGNSVQYETDGSSFSLRSPGQDRMLNTEDDVVVGPFADAESAKSASEDDQSLEWDFDDMDEKIEEQIDELDDKLEEQMEELDDQIEGQMDDLEAALEKI